MNKKRDILIGLCVVFIVLVLTLFCAKIEALKTENATLSDRIVKQNETINEYVLESNEQSDYIDKLVSDNQDLQNTIESKNREIETYKTQVEELKKAKKKSVQPQKVTRSASGDYYTIQARVTSYCSCRKCCGKWASNRPKDENGNDIVLTASGKRAVPKYTLGASSCYPFGTKVEIPNVGVCEVMDRGSGVKSAYHFDMYFSSHSEALKWQNKIYEVKVYEINS